MSEVFDAVSPAGYSPLETEFGFRINKDKTYKRPSVTVTYPVLNKAGVLQALNHADEKVAVLVLETLNQNLFSVYLRDMVDADSEFSQDTLNTLVANGSLSIEALANLPKSERRVLSKEDLEALAKEYIKYMPEISGKSEDRVKSAAGLFVERFKRCTGENSILLILQNQLALFIEKAPEEVVKEHEKALVFLADKLKELLNIRVSADSL